MKVFLNRVQLWRLRIKYWMGWWCTSSRVLCTELGRTLTRFLVRYRLRNQIPIIKIEELMKYESSSGIIPRSESRFWPFIRQGFTTQKWSDLYENGTFTSHFRGRCNVSNPKHLAAQTFRDYHLPRWCFGSLDRREKWIDDLSEPRNRANGSETRACPFDNMSSQNSGGIFSRKKHRLVLEFGKWAVLLASDTARKCAFEKEAHHYTGRVPSGITREYDPSTVIA